MKEWITADMIAGWIARHGIQILNVAGPRPAKILGFMIMLWKFSKLL